MRRVGKDTPESFYSLSPLYDKLLLVCAVVLCIAAMPIWRGPRAVWRANASPLSYVGIFTDLDFFVHAIAADLSTYRRLTHAAPIPALQEIGDVSIRIYQKGVVQTPSGGWLFEPGGWEDHPDYRYSGYTVKALGLAPNPAPRIAWDASHSTRFPLWINSERLATTDSARARYFARLQQGLCRQFFATVVVPPDSASDVYLFNNFMDGRNGIFRLNYANRGALWGYGPYELSATVFLGWWAPLGAPAATMYQALHDGFPYSDSVTATYAGPFSATKFQDGTYRLLTALAARVAGGPPPSMEELRAQDADWERILAPTLQRRLWAGEDAEAGQYPLMIPLHVAFREHRVSWEREFASHFSAFVASRGMPPASNLLGELHYMYFASRFMVLAAQSGETDLVPEGLAEQLESRIVDLWQTPGQVISQTGWGEPSFREFRSYEQWKLSLPKSYPLPDSLSTQSPTPTAGCSRGRPRLADHAM